MTDLSETLPKTTADYKAILTLLLDEMMHRETQMQQDRVEIERLRAASQVITQHTDTVLERLEKQLKALGKAA